MGSDKQRNGVAEVSVVVKNDGIEVKEEAIIGSRGGVWTNDEYHNCMGGGSEAITGKKLNEILLAQIMMLIFIYNTLILLFFIFVLYLKYDKSK